MTWIRTGVVTKSAHHRKSEFEWVAPDIFGNLIDKALDSKQSVIVGNTAHRPDWNSLFNRVLTEGTHTLMRHIIPVIRTQYGERLDITNRRWLGFAVHEGRHHAKIQTELVEAHPTTNDVVRRAG